MSDPSRIYENLPEVYDKSQDRDLYKLLSGLAKAIIDGDEAVTDFVHDQSVEFGDGDGLSRLGEGLAISRPTGMPDSLYSILIPIYAGAKRGTIQAIRSVFEAAMGGITGTLVEDRQTNGSIPEYEIWIHVSGLPAYEFANYYSGDLVIQPPFSWEYAYFDAYSPIDTYSGDINAHWWNDVPQEIKDVVNNVKLAGTIIVYK